MATDLRKVAAALHRAPPPPTGPGCVDDSRPQSSAAQIRIRVASGPPNRSTASRARVDSAASTVGPTIVFDPAGASAGVGGERAADGHPVADGFQAFVEVWGQRPDPPAITVAVVAGLAVPGALVEIEAVAAVPR